MPPGSVPGSGAAPLSLGASGEHWRANSLRVSRNCFSVGCRAGAAETWEPTGAAEDADEAVWVPQAVRAREPAAAMTTDAVKRIDGMDESSPHAHRGA